MIGLIVTMESNDRKKLDLIVKSVEQFAARTKSRLIIVASHEVSEALPSEFDVWTVVTEKKKKDSKNEKQNGLDIESLPEHRLGQMLPIYGQHKPGDGAFAIQFARQAAGVFRDKRPFILWVLTDTARFAEQLRSALEGRVGGIPVDHTTVNELKR